MNYLKENPVGIDQAIEKQQTAIYKALSKIGDLDGYGRVYKNQKKGKGIFEIYKGKGEYENIVHSDTSKFFFEVESPDNIRDGLQADVNIHFIIDLSKFYSSTTERKDEEIKVKVYNSLIRTLFSPERQYRDASKLKSNLNSYFSSEKIDIEDMHPKHIFTISGKMNYNYKNCN